MKTSVYFKTAIRILLGTIFLYAGSISSRSPEEFSESIAGYRLLPAMAIVPLALTLPPMEMLVGLFLIIGRPPRMAAFSALVLTLAFIIALGSALARGLVIDCGCFGHSNPSRSHMWLSLGRDVLLAGTLAGLYWSEFRQTAVCEISAAGAGGKK